MEGSWSGNDTISKTICDLNKIISNDARWDGKSWKELGPEDLLYFVPTKGWKSAFRKDVL